MSGPSRAAFSGLIVGLLLALASPPASAEPTLFSDESEIQFVIEGPIGALVRTAPRSTDPVPATVTLAGSAQPFQIELSARGFSRRTGGFCTFPPLRLDFDKPALHGTLLEGQNRLKLVTRCRPGANYEQLTVLEYTVYRLYNVLTPVSFRVRPARVTYRDNAGSRRDLSQFNFLIEDLDDVAQRNHLVALDVANDEVASSQLEPRAAAMVGLFQFMIGNLDWDMVRGPEGEDCCHNGKLLSVSATNRTAVTPIPYDFDYSGFVNAPYALPPVAIRVPNVRTRYYRGYCRHNDALPAAVEVFRARRAALNAVIDGEMRLNEARRQAAHRYVDEFFAVLDDPQRFNSQIIERCR